MSARASNKGLRLLDRRHLTEIIFGLLWALKDQTTHKIIIKKHNTLRNEQFGFEPDWKQKWKQEKIVKVTFWLSIKQNRPNTLFSYHENNKTDRWCDNINQLLTWILTIKAKLSLCFLTLNYFCNSFWCYIKQTKIVLLHLYNIKLM